MQKHEINTINETFIAEPLRLFKDVGLEYVEVEDAERLKIIGGSRVETTEYGYEISEPEFAIFFEDSHWIGVIQDMHSFEDINLSKTCDRLLDAVYFVCGAYQSGSSNGNSLPH